MTPAHSQNSLHELDQRVGSAGKSLELAEQHLADAFNALALLPGCRFDKIAHKLLQQKKSADAIRRNLSRFAELKRRELALTTSGDKR